MPTRILTDLCSSISELKANPTKVIESADGMPIAILNRNDPVFYCVPAKLYEAMMDVIEDVDLLEVALERIGDLDQGEEIELSDLDPKQKEG
jgi:antitoxin StbD